MYLQSQQRLVVMDVFQDAEVTGDTVGYTCNTDGKIICSHYSSGIHWTMHDMGTTSDWKRNIYSELYPDGYEVEWLGQFDSIGVALK